MSRASQGINFPVNHMFSLIYNLRTVFNTDPIWQFCTPIILAIAFAAYFMLPEMGIPVGAGLLISQKMLIDSLMANSYLVALFWLSRNLFRTPILALFLFHCFPIPLRNTFLVRNLRTPIAGFFICLLKRTTLHATFACLF